MQETQNLKSDLPPDVTFLGSNEFNNAFLDKQHALEFDAPSVIPSDLNNLGNRLPPIYEFTLEENAVSTAVASTSRRTFKMTSLCRPGLEDAKRALEYAEAAWDKQDWAEARIHYTNAAAIFRITENVRREAVCLQRLGEICRILSQFQAARAHILQAHVLFGQCRETARQLMCERWLARTVNDEGNTNQARLLLQVALDTSRSARLRESEGWCLLHLGKIEGTDGRLVRQALDIAQTDKFSILEDGCLAASSTFPKGLVTSYPESPTASKDAQNNKTVSNDKVHTTHTTLPSSGGLGSRSEEPGASEPGASEDKRRTDPQNKLLEWQNRIQGKFPSSLVQPHRRFIMDGRLDLVRYVRIMENATDSSNSSGAVTKVDMPCLSSDGSPKRLMAILCNDLLVLCKEPPEAEQASTQVELWAVLRMQGQTHPASIISDNGLKIVDNKAVLYFNTQSASEALSWQRAINQHILSSK